VEREVPQTEEGSKDAPHNVVPLWDWIGPHDELVPFGRPGQDHQPDGPAKETPDAAFATADAPASASDFWGERAASVHDALQAPGEEWVPADSGAAVGSGPAQPAASTSGATPAEPSSHLDKRRRFALIHDLRLPRPARRRRAVMAGAAAIAVVGATGTALALSSGGSTRSGAVVAKTQVASVLTTGMHRVLSLDLPVISPRPDRTHPAVDRHRVAVARVTSHPRSVPERVHYAPTATATIPAVSHAPVQANTAQAGAVNPPPTTTADSVSRPSTTSNPSSAPVSATGQSGALGPVQSPNG
jgi:hypothetical protein